MSPGEAVWAHWKVREKGHWRQFQGLSPGGVAAALCSSGCRSYGDAPSLGGVCLRGKKGVGRAHRGSCGLRVLKAVSLGEGLNRIFISFLVICQNEIDSPDFNSP